jgi:addiction module RelE/StbE family toxin
MSRPVTTVRTTSDFEKAFRRLPTHIQDLTEKKDCWFRANAFEPRLRTHKLKGPLAGYWSYSINQQYRVLFRFLSDHEVLYYDVGTHEIYR